MTQKAKHREQQRSRVAKRSQILTTLVPYLLLAPAFALLTFVLLYPTFYNIYLSFWEWRFINPSETRFVGFENYRNLFVNTPLFWKVLRFTLLFTVLTIVLEFVLGLGSALLLNRLTQARRLISTLILMPYLVAPIAVGLSWRLLWASDYGLVNYAINLLGGDPISWLVDPKAVLFAVIIPEVWRSTPFVTMILLAGLATVPKELEEAAEMDGANAWQKFISVTLPFLIPSLTVALLFQTIFKLRVFDLIVTLTGGGPGNDTVPVGILIYRTYFRYLDGGQSATLSVVLLVLGVFVSFLYLKFLYREVDA